MAGDDELTDIVELSAMSIMFFLSDIEDADLEDALQTITYVGRDNTML